MKRNDELTWSSVSVGTQAAVPLPNGLPRTEAAGRSRQAIVSGALRKTPSSTTRSTAIKSRLLSANPVAYGVVHCLEDTDSRSPRREVLYWSSRHSPYWRNPRLHAFQSLACGRNCAGCYRNR
jgi:hypothetical protein